MSFFKYMAIAIAGFALYSATPARADGPPLIVMVKPSNSKPTMFAQPKRISGMPKVDPDPFSTAMHSNFSNNLALSDTAAVERNKTVTAAVASQKEGLAQLVAMQTAIEMARNAPVKEKYGPPNPMQPSQVRMSPTVLPGSK